MTYRIGIDIGGTCTDCVVLTEHGRLILAKSLSTPSDFSRGIADALTEAARQIGISREELLGDTPLLVHSTTIGENAIVDGRIAKTALLATRGFGSTLWATRGGYGRWSGLSDEERRDPIRTRKPTPIVPLSLTREVTEQITADDVVLASVDVAQVESIAEQLAAESVSAVAVALLWSCIDARNERVVAAVLRRRLPGAFIALSSDVAGVMGEYERASTAAISAAIGPTVRRYLQALGRRLRGLGFRGQLLIMQSYGGVTRPIEAARRPAGIIESGPVGGLVGCAQLGTLLGHPTILSADMGGTTFKLGSIRAGLIEYQQESSVLRYHMSVPKLDIGSFGIAGGSVISVDRASGTPRIGPRSAGSSPGPVCYGLGGAEATITDVDAILGYLNPRYYLGGRGHLDVAAARAVFERDIAGHLGLDVAAAAAALYRLANSLIYNFVHKATVQKGLDPRTFALYSTGGTAGMHLPAVADKVGVPVTVVPHAASVYGAFGAVTADVVADALVTKPLKFPAPARQVRRQFELATDAAIKRLPPPSAESPELRVRWSVDMRFRRQVHLITVPLAEGAASEIRDIADAGLDAAAKRFESMYRDRYGPESAYPEAGIELVAFRARAWEPTSFRYASDELTGGGKAADALVERRTAYVPDTLRIRGGERL